MPLTSADQPTDRQQQQINKSDRRTNRCVRDGRSSDRAFDPAFNILWIASLRIQMADGSQRCGSFSCKYTSPQIIEIVKIYFGCDAALTDGRVVIFSQRPICVRFVRLIARAANQCWMRTMRTQNKMQLLTDTHRETAAVYIATNNSIDDYIWRILLPARCTCCACTWR